MSSQTHRLHKIKLVMVEGHKGIASLHGVKNQHSCDSPVIAVLAEDGSPFSLCLGPGHNDCCHRLWCYFSTSWLMPLLG